jgi:hypothetical protein
MRWKNHVDIASAVAERLALSPELRKVLKQGVLQPDWEGDKVLRLDRNALPYRKRVRHHRARKRFIRGLLWKARLAHLEGREEDAVWCLGRALHYVQDGSVAVGPFHIFHDGREAELGRRKVMPQAMRLGEECALPSPLFVDLCLRSLAPKRSAKASMYQACLLSSALSCAVLSPPASSLRLAIDTRKAAGRHRAVFIPLAVIAGLSSALLLLQLDTPLLVPISALLAYLILRSDRTYYHLRCESRWFVPTQPQGRTV